MKLIYIKPYILVLVLEEGTISSGILLIEPSPYGYQSRYDFIMSRWPIWLGTVVNPKSNFVLFAWWIHQDLVYNVYTFVKDLKEKVPSLEVNIMYIKVTCLHPGQILTEFRRAT